ncbi:helix-turn-helix domain-containing protein [Pseudoalteromonas sp. XMcav1-K]|uniref:helix-turn-helix domain-containing protein n=1 Tax=Pseudoalteromonas sp. XMcav1-K TaxID=3374372 RepID=UPI003756ADFE
MKINAAHLKSLRESRCWSQQALSEFSGLSLRTIQRIEAKSVASKESIKCLAAVYEVPVQSLCVSDLSISESSAEIDDEQVQKRSKQRTSQLKRMYIQFAFVFACHMFGFVGIFFAYDEQRIDSETFQVLKNSLSIVLVFSALYFMFHAYKLKRKLGIGSSEI